MGCSTGLGAAKSEGPGPVPPTLGKANVDFVVEEVVPVVVTGVGLLVGNENVGAGAAVGLEVMVVGGAGVTGLEKKLGTVVLVAVAEGSGFVVEVGVVVGVGLAKKLGRAGCAGTGTVTEGVGAGVGVTNKFCAGSLVSGLVVVLVVGFDWEVAEGRVNKLGVVVLVVEAVVGGLNETAGTGT